MEEVQILQKTIHASENSWQLWVIIENPVSSALRCKAALQITPSSFECPVSSPSPPAAQGGGVVRDVLCKRDVRILHSHAELYATTAAAGASVSRARRRRGRNPVNY